MVVLRDYGACEFASHSMSAKALNRFGYLLIIILIFNDFYSRRSICYVAPIPSGMSLTLTRIGATPLETHPRQTKRAIQS
jgi:hypothetical protein